MLAEKDPELRDLCTDVGGKCHGSAIAPTLLRPQLTAGVKRTARAILAPKIAELVECSQPFFQAIYDFETPRMHGALGRTFALAGRKKQALEVLRKLESYAKARYVSPLEFAWIQFALGETDLGFRWMQKALEDRSFDLISIKVDPRFDSLKGDPRFEAIARRMSIA